MELQVTVRDKILYQGNPQPTVHHNHVLLSQSSPPLANPSVRSVTRGGETRSTKETSPQYEGVPWQQDKYGEEQGSDGLRPNEVGQGPTVPFTQSLSRGQKGEERQEQKLRGIFPLPVLG